LAASGAPQTAQLQALVTIQVAALDGQGQPVTDLRAADLRITDGGKAF